MQRLLPPPQQPIPLQILLAPMQQMMAPMPPMMAQGPPMFPVGMHGMASFKPFPFVQGYVAPTWGIAQTQRPKAQQQICCAIFHQWALNPYRNGRPPHSKGCTYQCADDRKKYV